MLKFTFRIISTINIGYIGEGDELYGPSTTDDMEKFDTESEAAAYAQDILNGLSGSRAFNQARDYADIEVIGIN